ncbi:MAG: VOC family protein [Pseudomonadales bacterium]
MPLNQGTPNQSLTGLKTRIETPLYQECRAFYTEHLGMKVLDSWDENSDKGVILGLGSSAQGEAYLELAYVETRNSYEGISLQFRVGDLDVVAEELRDHLEFRGPEERPWGSRYLYLEDPAGIQIILYEGEQ